MIVDAADGMDGDSVIPSQTAQVVPQTWLHIEGDERATSVGREYDVNADRSVSVAHAMPRGGILMSGGGVGIEEESRIALAIPVLGSRFVPTGLVITGALVPRTSAWATSESSLRDCLVNPLTEQMRGRELRVRVGKSVRPYGTRDHKRTGTQDFVLGYQRSVPTGLPREPASERM